ncbi:hypothetical protein I4U23_008879 [Adineta vaga]|nr:hypothetical protein I4U23_008879 [Adineta vaga]
MDEIMTTNNTNFSDSFFNTIFIWCYILPLIHVFSLFSNIICIIVFSSNVFIKKPIAIYFICLLLSDSMVLFIGYINIPYRETPQIIPTSSLCASTTNLLIRLIDSIFSSMERYCLEWILYKVLWLRVSTILLAILSVQRTRTFFSLSYHETRLCAFSSCILSIILAFFITWIEWTGIHYVEVRNPEIYTDIFQTVFENSSSKEFYSSILYRDYNGSTKNYPCLMESLNMTSLTSITNQSDCLSMNITQQFQSFTTILHINREMNSSEIIDSILLNTLSNHINSSNQSVLKHDYNLVNSSDFILRLFDNPSCKIAIDYSLWLKGYDFFNSVSWKFSRRTMAIFFGNALPSFVAAVANLLSIKVICFSKSLKYLKKAASKNRRKRRLQNDLRAFLVIIIESFLVILISWGIPIFLTMYYCSTIYVINFSSCPEIKDYLVLFLCTDLLNSSSNCLLYSLSGKLFRRRLILILKTIFVCGHGTLWNIKQHSLNSSHHPLERQLSNNLSTNINQQQQQQQKHENYRQSGRLSSPNLNRQQRRLSNSVRTTITYSRSNGQPRNVSDDGSNSLGPVSDDYHGERNSISDIECDTKRISQTIEPRKSSLSIGSYLLHKVRSMGSTSSGSSKAPSDKHTSKRLTIEKPKRKNKTKRFTTMNCKPTNTIDFSVSTSSITGSISHGSQRKHSITTRYSVTKVLLSHTTDKPSIIVDDVPESFSSL